MIIILLLLLIIIITITRMVIIMTPSMIMIIVVIICMILAIVAIANMIITMPTNPNSHNFETQIHTKTHNYTKYLRVLVCLGVSLRVL